MNIYALWICVFTAKHCQISVIELQSLSLFTKLRRWYRDAVHIALIDSSRRDQQMENCFKLNMTIWELDTYCKEKGVYYREKREDK